MAVGYCRVADHKVSSLLICVLFIGMDIKWMRLSKPKVSVKTRQAYTQSILPIPPAETLPHIPSWKTSQALLLLLYHLNKGLWLALLIPDARYAFVTQYNNKTALAIHCFTLEIAECPLEAQASPRESSVLPAYHLQGMKRMQQSTWTCLTSFLNSARSSSDPVDQLFYLVSKTRANFPFPSVSGARPAHCCWTHCLWSSCSFLSQLQWLQVFMYLTAHSVLKPVGWDQQELMARGAAVTPKVVAGEGLDAPILIFGNSDPVSCAHKVPVLFKTVPSGFSPAYSVKGAVLPCHRVIIFRW